LFLHDLMAKITRDAGTRPVFNAANLISTSIALQRDTERRLGR
jgi:hypothetical protein